MAERRMFAKTIIDSDAFLEMPMSSQALYFHLAMRADDDGFINNPKKIQRVVGASEDDLKVLIAKNFILTFESGIIVIKHWRIHNYIQKDRYKPTVYQEEKDKLTMKKNKAYTYCIQDGYNLETQVRLGKDSIGKDSIGDDNNIDNIIKIYEENFGTISPTAYDKLNDLVETYSDKYVEEAMKRAIFMNKKSLAYVSGILKQWKNKSWDEIINEENKGKKPDWLDKKIEKQIITDGEKEELEDLLKEFK